MRIRKYIEEPNRAEEYITEIKKMHQQESKLDDTEEHVNQLEDRVVVTTQTQQKKEFSK